MLDQPFKPSVCQPEPSVSLLYAFTWSKYFSLMYCPLQSYILGSGCWQKLGLGRETSQSSATRVWHQCCILSEHHITIRSLSSDYSAQVCTYLMRLWFIVGFLEKKIWCDYDSYFLSFELISFTFCTSVLQVKDEKYTKSIIV